MNYIGRYWGKTKAQIVHTIYLCRHFTRRGVIIDFETQLRELRSAWKLVFYFYIVDASKKKTRIRRRFEVWVYFRHPRSVLMVVGLCNIHCIWEIRWYVRGKIRGTGSHCVSSLRVGKRWPSALNMVDVKVMSSRIPRRSSACSR